MMPNGCLGSAELVLLRSSQRLPSDLPQKWEEIDREVRLWRCHFEGNDPVILLDCLLESDLIDRGTCSNFNPFLKGSVCTCRQ
jgi:hypothetical protein